MGTINTQNQSKLVRRGNIRPKLDLVKGMYVRLARYAVTEGYGQDKDYAKVVRSLEKFISKR